MGKAAQIEECNILVIGNNSYTGKVRTTSPVFRTLHPVSIPYTGKVGTAYGRVHLHILRSLVSIPYTGKVVKFSKELSYCVPMYQFPIRVR